MALKAEGKVKSFGLMPWLRMSEKLSKAVVTCPFWAAPEMMAVKVTTEGDGASWRTSWADLIRPSFE